MPRTKLFLGIVVLCILGLLLGSCASEPSLEVRSAAEGKDVVLDYLLEYDTQNAPSSDIVWQEEDVTPQDWVGAVFKEFISDEWTIRVSYPVVPLENTVYQVVVSSIKLGWHWKGTVEFDGSVTELSAFKQMSKEESQRIAEEFVKNSPTFLFDGIEETLRLTDTLTARYPYCWVFIFEFDSSSAGYGDRTGQATAQVITHHKAVITVQQLEIISVVMDEQWDVINQEMINVGGPEPEGALTVAELLENPVYDTEITIYGKVSLLNELFCPCFALTSNGETVQVWYDLMVENDDAERPSVSVEGVSNGDTVIVTGEFKGEGGVHYNQGDFWASAIIVLSSSQTGAVENTTWVLQSYGEQSNLQTVLQGTEITAIFDSIEGQVHGSAGCNGYFGSYEMEGNNLSIPGPIGATVMSCGEKIDKQEREYLSTLQAAESYKIEDGELTIICGTQILVFKN